MSFLRSWKRIAIVGLPILASTTAQTRAAENDSAGLTTYDQSFFAAYNAITAEDLLRRIPGIQDLLNFEPDQDARGFGSSGSPFLFNGRRLSGKANDPIAALRRIQARQVLRVEIIRGSVPGLDVRIGDEGVLVNVVLEETLQSSYGSWEASTSYFTSGAWNPGAKFSYAGDYGALAYTLAVEAEPARAIDRTRDTHFLPPSVLPIGRVALGSRERSTNYAATAGLTYTFATGNTANLNGRYNREPERSETRTDAFAISAAGIEMYTVSTVLLEDESGDASWEIGGDYEHGFDAGDSFRALFVITEERWPSVTDFYRPAGGTPVHAMRQDEQPHRTEKIARGTYTWAIAPGRALEFGGEIALNTHDQVNLQFEDRAGALAVVPLFNSSAKVSETRLESISRYTWQVTPEFYAEAAIDSEYSRLKQRGVDVNTSRDFFFAKPRLDLRYDVSPRFQARGRVLRAIGQLDFGDFVSSIDSEDVRIGVIQAGNPNLVPEKTWTFETTGEYRLPADQGSLSVRVFYNTISDAVDKVLIAPEIAGTGNIGDGRSYGAEAKLGMRLGWLGVPGASIDVSGLVQDSSVRDAFTGLRRPLQEFQNYRWLISFRHDLAWNNLAYGVAVDGEDAQYESDIDFVHWLHHKPEATAFVEMRALDLTFRLEAAPLRRLTTRDRFLYLGNRAAGVLRRQELRRQTSDAGIKLIIKGTF